MISLRQFFSAPNLDQIPLKLPYPHTTTPSLLFKRVNRTQVLSEIDSREIERYYQSRVMKDSCIFLNMSNIYIVIVVILLTYLCQTKEKVCEAFMTKNPRNQANQSLTPSPSQTCITLTNPWVNIKVHIVPNVTITNLYICNPPLMTNVTVSNISTRTTSCVMLYVTQYPSFMVKVSENQKFCRWNRCKLASKSIAQRYVAHIKEGHQRIVLKVKVQHRKHHRKKQKEERRQKRDNLGYQTVLQGHERMGQNLQLLSQFYNVDKVQFRQQHGWNWTRRLMGDRFWVATGTGAGEPQWDQWTQRPMGSWTLHSGVIGLWNMWRHWDA